jgi:hypothetical protein
MPIIRQPTDALKRMRRVRVALEGLSVGDALGEQFFLPGREEASEHRALPIPPWFYTTTPRWPWASRTCWTCAAEQTCDLACLDRALSVLSLLSTNLLIL